MSIKRTATAEWKGKLSEGDGTMAFGSGAFKGKYSFKSRFEDGVGTNPEELIGAAEAGCYAMAFSLNLEEAGFDPDTIQADASVSLVEAGGGFKIDKIELTVVAHVPGIEEDKFQELVEKTRKTCPVSVALQGTEISVDATLK